jgi:hypothetical protein
MNRLPNTRWSPFGIGIASFVSGAIGLLFGFMPILGASISACGLIGGLAGCTTAFAGRRVDFRWSAAAAALSLVALAINVGIASAPAAQVRDATKTGSHRSPEIAPPRRSPFANHER